MGEIVLSAFADEFSKELDRQIEAMNRFSIGWIELRGVDGKNVSDLTAAEAAEVGRRMAAGGVRASSIGSPLGKIAVDGDMAGHLERARRCFETANLLGTPLCRVFSFYLPKGSDPTAHREAVLERVGALLDLADEHGVTLCHENEAGIYGESPERCLDLLTAFGGRLRCVFDMGNFVLGGYPPYPAAYAALKPYIRYFHIKDALASGAIVPA
ncbi:MAG: sugar phosphate isomerase/epimerase, partial [Oscillospiraceae bacterium]|nr:sugar phosphate isomerase/epimerase [Oscillospiraceae bacterium]